MKMDGMVNAMKAGLKKAAYMVPIVCMLGAPMMNSVVYAASDSPIGIEKPDGWKQDAVNISVSIDTSNWGEDITISKVEAKVGENGSWEDITSSRSLSINRNSTVYVRVTDSAGNTYEQNRSIKCYDSEKPTLSASLSDGVLTIQGNDTVSGIASITVNGTTYTDLSEGLLKVQLTQKEFTTKKITISCKDGAGNESDTYSLQNPYYEWAVKQAAIQKSESENSYSGSGSGSGESEKQTPLPQSADPSGPTSATGTVEERVVTGVDGANEKEEKKEDVESMSSKTTNAGKEFYTISTKSGKTFYLVVDNESSEDNVYFLTEVSERDLMNFTLSDTVTLPDVDTVYAELDSEADQEEEETTAPEETTETEEEPEVQMPEDSHPLAGYLLIGLIAAGVFGGAYYLKVYKPKHENDGDDEYEDEYEEDYEEDSDEENPESDTESDVRPLDDFLDDEDYDEG